ncbi:19928_t:CDS:2, partial [Gigaspora rosea]
VEEDNSFNNQNNTISNALFASNNPKVQDYFSNENRTIGLISLGLLYMDGKGITVNQQIALKLFLKSVSIGSDL